MKDKQIMVGMVTKEIQNSQMQKNEMDFGKKVIKGNQNMRLTQTP